MESKLVLQSSSYESNSSDYGELVSESKTDHKTTTTEKASCSCANMQPHGVEKKEIDGQKRTRRRHKSNRSLRVNADRPCSHTPVDGATSTKAAFDSFIFLFVCLYRCCFRFEDGREKRKRSEGKEIRKKGDDSRIRTSYLFLKSSCSHRRDANISWHKDEAVLKRLNAKQRDTSEN